MFQNRNKSQEKQKKPRVLSIGTRRPVVIALWALLICAFAFAVYKDFTAVDTHTVHETTVVQEEVTDTNAIESFVTNFAKVYYSWEQSAASIEQRTENLKYYLTDELLTLNVDTVRSDVPVSSKVEDVQIWSVEEIGDKVYKIVYSVSQNVINGEESSVITSVYEVSVYVDDAGDMVIIQSPTITGKPQKSGYVFHAVPNGDGTGAFLLCQRWCAAGDWERQLCVCGAGESGLYQERRCCDGECGGAVS